MMHGTINITYSEFCSFHQNVMVHSLPPLKFWLRIDTSLTIVSITLRV